MTWLVALALPLTVIAGSVRVRRYSETHVAAEVTIAGRGLYFSRTADGTWCGSSCAVGACRRAAATFPKTGGVLASENHADRAVLARSRPAWGCTRHADRGLLLASEFSDVSFGADEQRDP